MKGAAVTTFLVSLLLCGVSSFDFWSSPRRAHVLPGGNVNITCEADVPLTDCRFLLPGLGYLDPVPNRVTVHKGTSIEYSLSEKHCSVSLRGVVDEVFYNLFSCRGRDQNGVYKTSESSLAVSPLQPIDLEIDTKDRVAVVLPGENFSFVCRSPFPLSYCGVWLPSGVIVNLSNGTSTAPANSFTFQYEYNGSGLENGECGVTLKNVNEYLNGVVWCSVQTNSTTLQYDYMSLIIAAPPKTLHLEVNGGNLYDGDSLEATCSALNSRPISTITWFMGDDVITSGVTDVTTEMPSWPAKHSMMSLTQTLTRTLRTEDSGKELKCVVGNVALPGGKSETKKIIYVHSDFNFTFKTNPRRAHVKPGSDVTVLCESSVPLTDCRFRLPEIGFLDISAELRHSVSPQVVPNVEKVYTFLGVRVEFFWHGQTCGLNLKRVSEKFDGVISCRGRNEFGKYKTADMALAVSKLSPFDLEINKRHAVVSPGQSYTLLCLSPLPLIYCSIWLPHDEILDLSEGHDSQPTNHKLDYEYHGQGLDRGECGITFKNVTSQLNGHVWCEGQTEDSSDQSDYMTMVVSRQPNAPLLSISPEKYNIGDTIEASCVVANSRPAAKITWFLGDQKITNGVHSMQDTTWSWDYDTQTVVQNLTRRLKEEDGGKELVCVAGHVTLPGGKLETKLKIEFTMYNDSSDISFHPNRKLVNSDTCGTIYNERRIVNGNKTSLFEFPWMALITYNTMNGVLYGCGGSLIGEQFVLTAAHCVSNLPKSWSVAGVRLGEHNFEKEIDCEDKFGDVICAPRPQNFTVKKVFFHPGFTNLQLSDDVAVIMLDRPAQLSDSVGTICLPLLESAQTIAADIQTMVVAGWGVSELGAQSADLRAARVPIVANQVCAQHYVKRKYLVSVKQICAGGVGGQDSCKGDSGGPLIHADVAKGQYVQYGIVSYGSSVCGSSIPTIYTHVGHYMSWILSSMQNSLS